MRKNNFVSLFLAIIIIGFTVGCNQSNAPTEHNSGCLSSSKITESLIFSETEIPDISEKHTTPDASEVPDTSDTFQSINIGDVPSYSGNPYVEINNNEPLFSDSDLIAKSFEHYSALDYLERCGTAYACVGQDIMPTEKRGSIGEVKPSGWHTVKYDIVSGKYLYNRCHLIGYQLSAENANTANLITGTRYMNVEGMLPFENMVADYIKETNNHVLYRVTPIFDKTNLVANGVQMEAKSVEDNGDGICFNVFVYNVQPGITIDYSTGDSWLNDMSTENESSPPSNISATYIYNKNIKKFHKVTCNSVEQMKESNKGYFEGDRSDLIQKGYSPCKNCNP